MVMKKLNIQPIITICTINYNSSDFVLNTLYCLEKITKNSYKVIIRDNSSNINDYKNLERGVSVFSNISLYRVENFNYTGSLAHGIAINDLVQQIDSKYGVILDADCTFLFKDWDDILINEINDQYPIVGTQAPFGGKSKKFKDFPLMFALFFDTNVMKKLQIDFRPKNIRNGKDTGYELRNKYIDNGYKGKLIKFRSTRTYKLGPFHKLIVAEYYLDGFEHIFVSHFGRGSTLGRNKYSKGFKQKIYKIPIFGNILINSKGKSEKKRWIRICQSIVDGFN